MSVMPAHNLSSMITNSFRLLLTAAFILMLFSVSGRAAVTELWRTGLTNLTLDTYRISAAAVDTNGSTIVAGVFSTEFQKLYVASFDAIGTKQWEFAGRLNFRVYVNAVAIRPDGNVVITFTEYHEFGTSLSIICVRAGTLLWERIEPNTYTGDDPAARVGVNESGELIVFGFDPVEQPPGNVFPASLSKIDIAGHELWRSRLPFIDIGTIYSPMPFALNPSGQPIVAGVGQDNFRSVVASISATTGRVRWKRYPRGIFQNTVALAAGAKSTCVGGEFGMVVYASNGRRLASRRDIRFASDKIITTSDGGFMLLSRLYGETATRLTHTGRIKWQNTTGVVPTLGLFEESSQAVIAVGPLHQNGDSLAFVRLDEQGQQVSTEIIGGYGGVSWTERGTIALTAPNGTLRVVVNRESYIGLGFTVAAYRVEP